ncbi:MAG: hypothetical protein Tsb002_09530 [Wenzhouxiangellaceae bacterium]
MKTKLFICIAFAAFVVIPVSDAFASCNAAGCWNMRVKQWRIVRETGDIWVRFEDLDVLDLDNLDPAICTPRTVFWGVAEKTMKIAGGSPAYTELKQAVMTAYMFDNQRMGFGVVDPDPNDAVLDCEFKSIDLTTIGN